MTSWTDAILKARAGGDLAELSQQIPFHRYLGITVRMGRNGPYCEMGQDDRLIGNPRLPALHGGTIGALLESAGIVAMIFAADTPVQPKTINLTIDFLRSARPVTTFARGVVTKHGRRVANVRIEAWQDDPEKPVAAAHAHFLLDQSS